ncbi:MAG: SRPBCC family protein [Deltaproteobacteria bacterium]|nr:SRPBCC family protein [Deltaproteobacteria bacterium]
MVKSEIIIECSKDHFLDIVWNFKEYPKFLKEVKSVDVKELGEGECEVTYEIDLIKRIRYTLKMKRLPNRIEWTFVRGDMMKDNKGSWEVEELGDGKIKVIYQVDIKFGFLVPGSVVDMLTKVNLPQMLNAFKSQAERT